MDEERLSSLPWLPDLVDEVQQVLAERANGREDCRPGLQLERNDLDEKIRGWTQSLGNPALPPALRESIETECAAAIERQEDIDALLAEKNARDVKAEDIVIPERALERVDRLANVLAANDPTCGNLELSLYIDVIDCFRDGKVKMRTCKLGIAPEAALLLADESTPAETCQQPSPGKTKRRRRNKLRVINIDDSNLEIDSLNYFATDPNRFAGIPARFFWNDTFQIPEKALPWYQEYSEPVFRRRQDGKFSYDGLARVFGKSEPTCQRACEYYLETHPGEVDQVQLSAGGPRSKRIDVAPIAEDVRRLWWDEGGSKLQLGLKFEVATTTIDRALKLAYAKTGEQVPTENERHQHRISRARKLLDAGESIDNIARILRTSNVTVRKLLKNSFSQEGVPMPDLRRRRRQAG